MRKKIERDTPKYNKRVWLNKTNSPSTGNVVAFDGMTTWREEKIRNVFLSKTDDDTIRDFVNKMKLLKDEIQLFITHLEKEL